ncbi:hypothetical protein DBV05_g2620 [Lasiodiplodia theobromae]|uniref:Uncharacterized protein n=1 Tax=Lasiodiplodia theobromae TaxID=45133 RepID=A0A5N5DM73_9PEZI|nr:hypothetical protein DBV05_g2620 [Lasiodiplodia theobromae]
MDHYTPAPRFHDFDGLTWHEWKEKCQPQWVAFQDSVNDSNRNQIRRLAMSHWHTFKDYEWVEKNLPKLTELDLSDLQDTIIYDDDFAHNIQGKQSSILNDFEAYEQLCNHKTLLDRLEKLWVRHWGCNALHDWKHRHVESGSGSGYDRRDNMEIHSRRKTTSGQTSLDVTSVITECKQLRTLAIRGPSLNPALSQLWRPRQACSKDEGSHAHFCTIVKGLEDNAPDSLRAIEFYQAEFAPRIVKMLRERTNISRVSISFGDILRRFAPAREADVENTKFTMAGETSIHAFSIYDEHSCKYETSVGKFEKKQLHESLNVEIFPPQKSSQRLRDRETRDFLRQWANSPQRTKGQSEPSYILSEKDSLLVEYLVTNRHESPVPGLNYFLVQLADAFNHCDKLSCNDQEVINEIPVSPFSFISPSPHHCHEPPSSSGIFVDDPTGESMQAFCLLHQRFGWAPLWDIDPLVDARNFPWNVGIELPEAESDEERRRTRINTDLIAPIFSAFCTLRYVSIPVRLLIGNRPRSSHTGLYWGDATAGHPADHDDDYTPWLTLPVEAGNDFSHDDDNYDPWDPSSVMAAESLPQREQELAFLAASARVGAATPFTGQASIAACADELVIRYPDWMGQLLIPRNTAAADDDGAEGREEEKEEEDDEEGLRFGRALLKREARGWQAWWRDTALRFTRLRRLRIRMPRYFDEFSSAALAVLLQQTKSDGGGWRGRWRVAFDGDPSMRAKQGGDVMMEFVVREWVKKGGKKVMQFSEREVAGSEQLVVADDLDVPRWFREMREGQRRRAWTEFVEMMRELGVLDSTTTTGEEDALIEATPDEEWDRLASESFVSTPDLRMPETPPRTPTPASLPVESITPAQTAPPPQEKSDPSPASVSVQQSGDVVKLESSSKPKKSGKGKATPAKQSSASKKRTRSSKRDGDEAGESSPLPPPKKAKSGKKSRWERELELLQS